jgi:hypothetical protein
VWKLSVTDAGRAYAEALPRALGFSRRM